MLADQMEVHNNREIAAIFRKMAKIDWLDTPVGEERIVEVQAHGENA